MTLTRTERDDLFADCSRVAAQTGGVVSRELFETICDFAAVGDKSAMRALRDIYRSVTADLIERRKGKR